MHSVSLVSLAALVLSVQAGNSGSKKTCKVKYSGGDDTANIAAAFKECSSNAEIVFEKKYTYRFYTPLTTQGLSNVKISIEGNIDLPDNMTYVQQMVNTTLNTKTVYSTPWWYIQGSDVSLVGSTNKEKGWIYGHGEQWWHAGNRILRPQIGTFNVTGGLLQDLKIDHPIAWGWHVPGNNIKIKDHYVYAKPSNTTRDMTSGFPFNTDGFNIAGHDISIDGYWGVNGDDCVSVVNGAKNVVARNGYCGFSSHGLSIGSLGRGGAFQTVENVLFENWVMDGAVYGARFKSWTGGQGYAKNVTWRNIVNNNVSTAIFVTQNYYDQDKGPRPENTNKTSTNIDGLHFENFAGYLNPNWTDGTCISTPCWNYVQGIETAANGIIFDLYNGTALDLQVKNFKVTPYKKPFSATTVICDPLTLAPGEQNTLGFDCVRGPFKATSIQA